jgi:release factor glutamine methyltransferase
LPHHIQNILSQDTATLSSTLALETSSARIEVQCLLQKTLNVPRVYLLAHPERVLTEAELTHYNALKQRRVQGEPIAYILGEREFFGLNYKVTPATLIPRPDTELLVELALQHIPSVQTASLSRPDGHPLPPAGEGLGERVNKLHILDLGTGSGAIALAIAHTRPQDQVLACDASLAALAVAQENAHTLELVNVTFLQSNWFAAVDEQRFDLIVSNPPYIAAGDPHMALGDVRFEPVSALISGVDGLDDIRHIITQSPSHLLPGGWLLLEHGYDQAERVRGLLQQAEFNDVFSACDLAGIERVSGGRMDVEHSHLTMST